MYNLGMTEAEITAKNIDKAAIDAAYQRRKKEIDSLAAYDRGEIHLDAPNLEDIVRDI